MLCSMTEYNMWKKRKEKNGYMREGEVANGDEVCRGEEYGQECPKKINETAKNLICFHKGVTLKHACL